MDGASAAAGSVADYRLTDIDAAEARLGRTV
jgi:hypothetical protein